MHQAVDLCEQHVRLRLWRKRRGSKQSLTAATTPQQQAHLPKKLVGAELGSMGIPSTIPQGSLLRAGQELPALGFPSLPQPSQSLQGSVTLHWGRLAACREPPGTEEPASVHSPAVRLRWEHFLGDGAGSMLARQSGHPLLLPSHELPATDCRAPQQITVCSWYVVLGQSKVL